MSQNEINEAGLDIILKANQAICSSDEVPSSFTRNFYGYTYEGLTVQHVHVIGTKQSIKKTLIWQAQRRTMKR